MDTWDFNKPAYTDQDRSLDEINIDIMTDENNKLEATANSKDLQESRDNVEKTHPNFKSLGIYKPTYF